MDSTFQAAGDAITLARGQVADKATDRLKQQRALKRVEGEDQESYFAFREYVFSGPRRDFKLIAELMGRPKGWITTRSKKYNWEQRVLAFDESSANLASLAFNEEVDRMARRQARMGRIVQAKGMQMVKRVDVTADHKLSEIAAFVRLGVDTERKAMGAKDTKTEKVIIFASFQEGANLAKRNPDPQDAGNDDPTIINLTETSAGVFDPEPAGEDEDASETGGASS